MRTASIRTKTIGEVLTTAAGPLLPLEGMRLKIRDLPVLTMEVCRLRGFVEIRADARRLKLRGPNSMSSSLMDQLRQETHSLHQKLHQVVNLTEMLSSRESYHLALIRYSAAVAPLEAALKTEWMNTIPAENSGSIDWDSRLIKASWLQQDRKRLGEVEAVVVSADQLETPVMSGDVTFSAGIGVAYVMEGMTLGATRIAPMISDQLQIEREYGGRFFAAYGAETGARWQEFRNWANKQSVVEEVCTATAQKTFQYFADCLSSDVNELLEDSQTAQQMRLQTITGNSHA